MTFVWAMLKRVPLKAWLGIVVIAAFGFVLWREHHAVQRTKRLATTLSQVEGTLTAERENTRKANESAKRYAARIGASRGPRSPPPRIMCRIPAAVSSASAAGRTDDAPAPDNAGVLEEVDIGPRIDVPFRACEENLIKLEELQRWAADR